MKYLFGILLTLILCLPTEAQSLKVPTLSPRSELIQEVGLTEVKISYSRPSAKGRKIWNGLVPYGEIWRTGANAATTITFSETVSIGNKAVPAGTYALYTIPALDIWTIILHKNTSMRSLEGNYNPDDDLMRMGIMESNSLLFVETFTIDIDDITSNSFNIKLAWADKLVRIPVKLDVDNQVALQMKDLADQKDGISHRDYFKAAEYNLHNDKNLSQAHAYIVNAMNQDKDNPRYGLLKGKIESKMGNDPVAKNTLMAAAKWAEKQNNANYVKQIEVYMKSMKM